MTELTEEVQKELAEKIEGRLVSFHIVSMLKMMLSSKTKDSGEPRQEGKKHATEVETEAKEAASEIIDIITKTIETGRVPDKRAA